MNKLQNILGTIGLVSTLGLMGCREFKIEYSPVLHEDAIVSEKNFSAPYTIAELKTNQNGIVKPVQVDYPAKYEIAFDGKIRFELDDWLMFNKFKTNDQADVSYIEKYALIYDDINNDRTNELTEKYFMDAEFIDAQPITDRILDRF
ncbi:Uncharacterised protein [uncultured archaeon]|nr:Uncharacterised protein [uncultured archaeon]